MSDAELRELRRRAEAEGDAAGFGRLAQACVREARWDEAGWALVQARARGGEFPEVEDALESGGVEEFPLLGRELSTDRGHAPLSALAWTPDGRTLLGGSDGCAVHAIELATGARRRVARLEGWIEALATDLEGRVVFCAVREGAWLAQRRVGPGPGVPERPEVDAFVALELATGSVLWRRAVPPRGVLAVAGWSPRAGLTFASSHAVFDCAPKGTLRRILEAPATGPRIALAWNREALGPCSSSPSPRARDLSILVPTTRAAAALAARPERILEVAPSLGELHVSPGGRFGAARYSGARVVALVDLASGNRRTLEPRETIRALAWSPSGRSLAVATQAGVQVFELGGEVGPRLDATLAETGSEARPALFERLARDPSSAATEWLLRLLERDAPDDDAAAVLLAATRCLAKRRRPVDRARLEAARAKLPERPGLAGLADYRRHLEWLALVLDHARTGAACNCGLAFPSALDHGSLECTGSEPSNAFEVSLHRCTVCRRRWRVARELDPRTGIETHHTAELPRE